MPLIIYLDESGDLGWSFDAPFRNGGSSRHLTIAALCVPSEKKHLPKRVIKKLCEKFGWGTEIEKKWSMMNDRERIEFAHAAHALCRTNPDKVESGNSLPDYIQTLLWFHLNCQTTLKMQPMESHKSRGIQFADMPCGAIQTAFEDNNFKYSQIIAPCLFQKRLYFG
ncbi:MAG: DUF3800 domain-containing protein [Candidatus Acidiferrales bacterium]